MVVRLVVEADDVQDAVETAKQRFEYALKRRGEDGTGFNGPFDYCRPMEEGHTVSGSDRWVDYADEPLAYPADSERGQEEIEKAWKITWEYLVDDLEEIRDAFAEADDVEDIANDEMIRGTMHGLDAHNKNSSYFLYDDTKYDDRDVVSISSPTRYNDLQERLHEDCWVVPLDVHQ